MKIKRIHKITGIGVFANFKSGGIIPFGDDNITLIYGENTVGKTTLVDIFRSVCEDESKYILDRITIPDGNINNQKIQFSVFDEGKEKNISYEKGEWKNNLLEDRIYVFDQKFIQDNIFEGIKQTRDNKTNFTNLVLGSDGVEISKEIEKKKEEFSKYSQKLSQASPDFVRHLPETEIIEFCQLKINRGTEELEQEKTSLTRDINKLQKINTFKSLQSPRKINKNEIVALTLEEKLKKIAESEYDQTASTAVSAIKEELEKLQKTHWVEEGVIISDDKNCPFCNQSLTPVRDRIDTYKKIFDTQFSNYKNNLLSEESEVTNIIDSFSSSTVSYNMRARIKLLRNYEEYVAWPDNIIYDFDTLIQETEDTELNYNSEIIEVKKKAKTFIDEKNKDIHIALEAPNIDKLKKYEANLLKNTETFNSALEKYSAYIEKTAEKLKGLDVESVKKQLAAKTASIAELDRQINRINQNTQCEEYLKIISERDGLRNEIKTKQEKLKKEQTTFLDEKFKAINDWFERLGSRDFGLNYKPSLKGNKPTCDLTVKYKNQEIESDNFKTVFSESDRRNLALSIFLACAEDETKILVLDDPVVSFDNNRISMAVKIIKELAQKFPQIVITTHYKPLIVEFVDQKTNLKYIELIKSQTGSQMVLSDCSEVGLSDYEQLYIKIRNFIDGNNEAVCDKTDLRIFLENHINIWFQPYINREEPLHERIKNLHDLKIIDEHEFRVYDSYREIYNPDAHNIGKSENLEELKTLADNLLRDLYEK